MVHIDDDVRIRRNSRRAGARQSGEGAVSGQHGGDVRVGAQVSGLVVGEAFQAAACPVSVVERNQIIVDQRVSPERHTGAWTQRKQTRFCGAARVRKLSRKGIVVEDEIAFESVALAIKVRAKLHR